MDQIHLKFNIARSIKLKRNILGFTNRCVFSHSHIEPDFRNKKQKNKKQKQKQKQTKKQKNKKKNPIIVK